MRRYLFLIAVLLAPAAASAEADLEGIATRQKRCIDQNSSNAGMVECSANAFGQADKLLNKVYGAAVKKLKDGDADAEETLRRLVASERAWVAYRDAECEFEGASMLGGSGEGLVVTDCRYTKTAERVKAIEAVLEAK